MKIIFSFGLFLNSISALAYGPDFSPRERVAIKTVLEKAKYESGGFCDYENLQRRPAGFNVQVYCNRNQSTVWYFVEVKPCLDFRGEWYLWSSTPVRLPVYNY